MLDQTVWGPWAGRVSLSGRIRNWPRDTARSDGARDTGLARRNGTRSAGAGSGGVIPDRKPDRTPRLRWEAIKRRDRPASAASDTQCIAASIWRAGACCCQRSRRSTSRYTTSRARCSACPRTSCQAAVSATWCGASPHVPEKSTRDETSRRYAALRDMTEVPPAPCNGQNVSK